ncbi:AGAP009293-PA-like protein [Anopheles sinensis]|uniref:AGAP009293-PA-like protein n=1 Tax=Anopheles sinensis TaxID=74873 RepID=A0A084W6N3_ANOSI|nr:AGAP009293-PA-like protein [Anopheles sinensis]
MEQLAHFVTKSFDFNNSRVLDLLNMTATAGPTPTHHHHPSSHEYGGRNLGVGSDSDALSNTSSSLGGDLDDEIHSHALEVSHRRVPEHHQTSGEGRPRSVDHEPPRNVPDEDEETIDIEITDLSYSNGVSGVGSENVVQSVDVVGVPPELSHTSIAAAMAANQSLLGIEPPASFVASVSGSGSNKDVALNLVRAESDPRQAKMSNGLDGQTGQQVVRPKPASELLKQSVDLVNGHHFSNPSSVTSHPGVLADGESDTDWEGRSISLRRLKT